jgi:hypothetical protein
MEETPLTFNYYKTWLVSDGWQQEFNNVLYCDRTGRAPVLYRDHKVKELVRLKADISTIAQSSFRKEKGKDGKMYYCFHYSIEVIYQSAYTRYTLIHKGK